jgi:hypothetical protein
MDDAAVAQMIPQLRQHQAPHHALPQILDNLRERHRHFAAKTPF